VRFGIIELVGLFAIVVGMAMIVGAAALVSLPLAWLVAGAFTLIGGTLAVYTAAALERAERTGSRPAGVPSQRRADAA
jgi:membrane protein implicated in regulation of membrane protease activity